MLELMRIYLKPYRARLVLIAFLVFLQAILQLTLPTLLAELVDVGIANADMSYIIQIGLWMLLITLVTVAVTILSGYQTSKLTSSVAVTIRERLYASVQGFSLQEYRQFGHSTLLIRTTNDVQQVQTILSLLLKTMLLAPMMFIGAFILSVTKNVMLSFILIAPLPIIILIVIGFAKKGGVLFTALQKKVDQLNRTLREGITGIRDIRSFNQVDRERERFSEANHSYRDAAIHVHQLMIYLTPIMMFILNFSIVALLWFGSLQLNAGELQVGDLMAFIQYAMYILFSIMLTSVLFVSFPRASVSAKRILEVLNTESNIKKPAQSLSPEQPSNLRFSNVSYQYPNAEKPVLTNITCTIPNHKRTVIVGGTGAGKSTFLQLIPRLFDVSSGNIVFGGIDLRNMDPEALRSVATFSPQNTQLFSGTIEENLRFGSKDVSKDEIDRALTIAQCTSFVRELPDGLQTMLTQNGKNLSGGQRQRLAIARALIRNTRMYLFDESFSAIDAGTKGELFDELFEALDANTVIIATQDVEIAKRADHIVVLDQGEIIADGTHDELLQLSAIYHELAATQSEEGTR
ncbi:ABC transporter ATP-binding protein [Geomicrobium sp. JCM 19039]|uniref:ABC transporter ATP-binding protein n=1 Tax=Geomicrobium sp. JCM 19039 TaxID=1460636 RepID=UPI0005A9237A|nr:ABC transporter ATP-binding protein [Geomicrobium sp. JCM 19039]